MPLRFVRGDLVQMRVDAIVNAANTGLRSGSGVCGAIFSAAGPADMLAACRAIGGCGVGQAVITPGFRLPARYVIHTVGPVWQGGHAQEEPLLASCYRSALTLAVEHGLTSVAFPLISSGVYGYPRDQAFQVAVRAISGFLDSHPECTVHLVIYGSETCPLTQRQAQALCRFPDARP